LLWPSIPALPWKRQEDMLTMSYMLQKSGLRYEEEIRMFCLRINQKFVSDHGKIIFIFHKSTPNLN
jgi:hypothetical protein